MKQRPLHSSGSSISSLGLGTVKFGRNQQVKYPNGFELPSDAQILSLLDTARENGINLLDTAPAYGSSEERIGPLLDSRRDDWVLMTKAGEEFSGGGSHFDFSRSAIAASIDRSLRRLRTDRLDCVLLHSDGNDLDVLDRSGAVEALRACREAGKVLSIGISTKTVAGGLRAIELDLDAVMVTYNPWQREEEPVLDAAAESGTTVFLKKALGSGWFERSGVDSSSDATPTSEDPVEASLRFVFSHPATTCAVVGTINPEHLVHNCEAVVRAESDPS